MTEIILPSITYYSRSDENAFFAWLHSIPGVVRVVGEHTDLVVTLVPSPLSDLALRELLALFHRYRLPMELLAQFETPDNSNWFRSTSSFWHADVFATGRA